LGLVQAPIEPDAFSTESHGDYEAANPDCVAATGDENQSADQAADAGSDEASNTPMTQSRRRFQPTYRLLVPLR
jgi:hypothetical protein